jgi:hypothetical protein
MAVKIFVANAPIVVIGQRGALKRGIEKLKLLQWKGQGQLLAAGEKRNG